MAHGTNFEQTAREALAALTTDNVLSVYSGKPGCCCGCNGKHSYNSKHVVAASASRGYDVTPDEINDKQVRRVLNIVQANAANLEAWEPTDNHFAITVTITDSGNQRLYIVYPTAEYVNMVAMAAKFDGAVAAQADAYVALAAR